MNKIERMLQELCPEGVEYKKLGEVSNITIGEFVHKNKQNLNGKYPVYNGGTSNTGFYDEFNNTKNKIIISARGANAGFVNRVFVNYWAGNSCYSIKINDPKELDWNYIYYYLKSNQTRLIGEQQTGSIPAVSKKQIYNIEIPIPPLPIQEEIVRILDHFTELTAELQARQEQYEYYRNKLLTFTKIGGGTQSVTWMKMSEICLSITSGGTPNTSKKEYYIGDIPWLRTQEVDWCDIFDTSIKISKEGLEKSSAKMIPKNCVIIAMYGATAAKVAINKIPLCTNQACCNLEINPQKAYYRFVYQWLCKEYRNLKAKGEGSQNNINSKKIKDCLIPVPLLSEQERIVTILDKFETLVNDLSQGLPAEIAAVQEQYEYYRNKLLTFNHIKSN